MLMMVIGITRGPSSYQAALTVWNGGVSMGYMFSFVHWGLLHTLTHIQMNNRV